MNEMPIIITRNLTIIRNPYFIKPLRGGFAIYQKDESGQELQATHFCADEDEAIREVRDLYILYCEKLASIHRL